MSYDINK